MYSDSAVVERRGEGLNRCKQRMQIMQARILSKKVPNAKSPFIVERIDLMSVLG